MKGVWVGYDVGCTMGLTLGHGAWQIDRPSNGSMWNSYSFQPVGQWMGYSFTDLGGEGCCRSLNALFDNVFTNNYNISDQFCREYWPLTSKITMWYFIFGVKFVQVITSFNWSHLLMTRELKHIRELFLIQTGLFWTNMKPLNNILDNLWIYI